MVENPINRYLINSTMLDDFVRDDDGGITLYLQHESPGRGQGSQLAAGAQGPLQRGDASLLAEACRPRWHLEHAAAGDGWTRKCPFRTVNEETS
jgi:hypothetical protein